MAIQLRLPIGFLQRPFPDLPPFTWMLGHEFRLDPRWAHAGLELPDPDPGSARRQDPGPELHAAQGVGLFDTWDHYHFHHPGRDPMIHGPWLVNLSHPLVLASASPRRTWILSQLGIPHSVDPAHIDEDAVIHPDPAQLVLVLARDKAMAISHRRAGELVLGADTVVYLSPDVLG